MCEFEKYKNMIEKMAHKYSDMWGVDFTEVESQGYLIYCEVLERYDVSKGSFATYLWCNLRGLSDFCRKYRKLQGCQFEENQQDDLLSCDYYLADSVSFLDYSKNRISAEAFNILEWMLSWKWRKNRVAAPSKNLIVSTFGFNYYKANKIWEELKMFWNNEGLCFYS